MEVIRGSTVSEAMMAGLHAHEDNVDAEMEEEGGQTGRLAADEVVDDSLGYDHGRPQGGDARDPLHAQPALVRYYVLDDTRRVEQSFGIKSLVLIVLLS